MKKILYYIFALSASVLTFTACSLSEEVYSEVDKSKFMKNASEAEIVLNGVYRNMVTDGMYGYHLSLMFPLSTDIAQCEGNAATSFREVPTNAFTPSNASVQSTWATLYNSIYNANDFIETLESRVRGFSQSDKVLANLYIAEARALRGLYYFELVRWYGNIVLMTNTAQSKQHPSTFIQADPKTVYEFIEKDLLFAAENLPYAVDDTYRKNNSYRMSRGAALGLLAKVYATWAGYPLRDETKWEKAATTAKLLIESGKHGLLDNYEQLWENTCNGIWNPKESLIEVSFYAPTVTGSNSEDPCGRIGKWNGVQTSEIAGTRGRNAGNVKVVHTFVLHWRTKVGDLRRDLSVANYKYNHVVAPGKVLWTIDDKNPNFEAAAADDLDPAKGQNKKQNYTPAKWDTEKYVKASNALLNNDKSNVNWYVLRYADVLLLYAEALNEWKGGPTSDAYDAVNMVRRRGYGFPMGTANSQSDLAANLSQTEFRKEIRKERAYELAFEGHRRQDLVRWDMYYETIINTAQGLVEWFSNANYTARQYTTKNKHELFPIPLRDYDLMQPNCKQNPGWN